jgi:hypothetical protein
MPPPNTGATSSTPTAAADPEAEVDLASLCNLSLF